MSVFFGHETGLRYDSAVPGSLRTNLTWLAKLHNKRVLTITCKVHMPLELANMPENSSRKLKNMRAPLKLAELRPAQDMSAVCVSYITYKHNNPNRTV